MSYNVTTVADLIAALSKLPQDAPVVPIVEWAKDTAISDKKDGVDVTIEDGTVEIRGWLRNCGTTLEIEEEEEEDEEEDEGAEV